MSFFPLGIENTQFNIEEHSVINTNYENNSSLSHKEIITTF